MPAAEVLIMLKKTASFIAYRQWIGRVLRRAEGKERAIIIDHVGNVNAHGMPDDHIDWDIENPPRGTCKMQYLPCKICYLYYKITLKECPSCKTKNPLFVRYEVGTEYIKLNKIDMDLVEKAKRDYAIQNDKERREKEIIYPYFSICSIFDEKIDEVRKWFTKTIGISSENIKSVNDFLISKTAQDNNFWVKNFTVKDMYSNNIAKAKKVFKQWLKQQ